MKKTTSQKIACVITAGLVPLVMSLSCYFTTSLAPEPLTMSRADALGDTVAPYPTLRIAFSAPIVETDVNVVINPSTAAAYALSMSANKDTLTIAFSGMLSGNTRYSFKLSKTVTTADSAKLVQGSDSIVVNTWPAESPPNSSAATADTLRTIMYGIVTAASDTDYFVPVDSTKRTFFLQTIAPSAECGLIIRDDFSHQVATTLDYRSADTLVASTDFVPPLHLLVFSQPGSAGSRYKLGMVP